MSGTSLRPFGSGSSLLLGGNSPLEIFQAMRQEMDRIFQQAGFGGLAGFGSQASQQGEQQRIIPAAEVTEDNENYRIALELPGIDPQNVEVNLSGSTLTVQAHRRSEHQESTQGGQGTQASGTQGQTGQQARQGNILISERSYGQIRRTFHLPNDVDQSRVNAEFRNGLLTLTLPKSAQSRDQQRRIEIKSS
jgi:HSP20 family protein